MSKSIIISVSVILFCLLVNKIKCQENYLINNNNNNMTTENSNQSIVNNTYLTSTMEPIVEFYTFPFIVVIATVCNILTFLVMRRKKMRTHSTCFYMAVLAIADELVILVGCLNYWIYLFFNKSIMFTQLGCKILCSALYGTLHFSVWIVVIMTIERYIAVAIPLQANILCTVNRAKVACMILALIIFSINFHFLITHSLINGECIPSSTLYEKFMENYWPWVDGIIYSYVPLTLLIIFNILIVHNLIKASENIKKLQNQTTIVTSMSNNSLRQNNKLLIKSRDKQVKYLQTNRYWCLILPFFCWFKKTKKQDLIESDPLNNNMNNNTNKNNFKRDSKSVVTTVQSLRKHTKSKNTVSSNMNMNHNNQHNSSTYNHVNVNCPPSSTPNSSNRRLTLMLLVVSITFCLTSVPIVTLQTIERYLKTQILSSNNHLVILKGIFLALQYLNHSINFFLYAVTGKTFRREFFALFGSHCNKSINRQNMPHNSKLNVNLNNYNLQSKRLKNLNNSTVTEYSSFDNINNYKKNYDYKYDLKSNKLIQLGDNSKNKKQTNYLDVNDSKNDINNNNDLRSSSVASIFQDANNNNNHNL